ncbi:MAG: DEAD/DEAH box helicase [Myxococcaceae bacterium]|nr:DEAD/DEAH box helicase [Myxococcaceae bacterium]
MARPQACGNRLLRIPTGFGKTAGVVLPWLFHRVVREDASWPLRLVFCLPMRVLVEQTERAVRDWLDRAGLGQTVRVHVLMGGSDAGPWALTPERPTILIGTQDMLLSRALNRGFGAARGKWPMEFGLLHQDTLWVMDEVQLMGVGLATSTQLAGLRGSAAEIHGAPRPTCTWWMSATLQPGWLETVDFAAEARALAASTVRIPAKARSGGLWNVRKALHREPAVAEPGEVAARVLMGHAPGSLTLVIVNTVRRAVEIFEALKAGAVSKSGKGAKARKAAPPSGAPELRLIHGRFRGHERADWAKDFLCPRGELPPSGRIIIATQVVEAGVDLSARLLVTELAPWPSLVQRFGRAARYEGDSGEVVVVGSVPADKQRARPYSLPELEASAAALERLRKDEADVSLSALEAFEEELSRTDPALLARLYPFAPDHVLRRKDLEDLFDTSADLSGVDLDVSRYIRGGEEHDVSVFWRHLEEPRARFEREVVGPVRREELCAVPVHELKDWLGKGDECVAYRLDYVSGRWERVHRFWHIVPGMTLMLPAKAGGYDPLVGWDPRSRDEVLPVEPAKDPDPTATALEKTSGAEEDDSLSRVAAGSGWKSIRVHGRETGAEAQEIGRALALPPALLQVLELAGRWHDVGKAHAVFQSAIREEKRAEAGGRGKSRELAKAPEGAWRRPPYPERPGFRHELASTLALFELLRRTCPEHPALLGANLSLSEALGVPPAPLSEGERVPEDHPLAREVAALPAADFDLLAWLVCTHHGKVRCAWTGTPHDQERGHGGIHGVCEGDELPGFTLETRAGMAATVPPMVLRLDSAAAGWNGRYGASWRERVTGLLERHGPFQLAYLEALLRAADARASQLPAEEEVQP